MLSAAALLAACAGRVPSGDSGVEGKVSMGPMCPVVQAGTDCPDAPYAAVLVIENESGREVVRTESSAEGMFRVALNPGTYRLVPQPGENGMPWAEPVPVVVEQEAWTRVEIHYDSGIR